MTSKINAVCRYFLVGNCKNGDKCQFLHDVSATHSDKNCDANLNLKVKVQPCQALLRGYVCMKGANCTFAHPEDKPIKTRPCPKLAQGHCPYGPLKCLYLHPEDAKNPNLKNLWQPRNKIKIQRECPKLAQGNCQFGAEKCRYLHFEDLNPMNRGFSTMQQGNIFYKTRPCPNFLAGENCPKGPYCTYIHPEDQPDLKTKPCPKIAEKGWCEYDSKCIFLHPDDRNKPAIMNNLARHNLLIGMKRKSEMELADFTSWKKTKMDEYEQPSDLLRAPRYAPPPYLRSLHHATQVTEVEEGEIAATEPSFNPWADSYA